MTTTLIGYARCSTDKQDLTAQVVAFESSGSRQTGSIPIVA